MKLFKDIKVGHPVKVTYGFGENGWKKARVDRLTKTMIIIGNTRFDRCSGRIKGATNFQGGFISPWSIEREAAWMAKLQIREYRHLLEKISRISAQNLSKEDAELLYHVLENHQQQKGKET